MHCLGGGGGVFSKKVENMKGNKRKKILVFEREVGCNF